MNTSLHSRYNIAPLRRFITEITDGPFGSSLTSSHYADSGARVIRLGNIGAANFKGTDTAYIPLAYYKRLYRHQVLPGDLLIAGLGDERHPVGRACLAPADIGPAIVKADCFRARLDESRVSHRYAAWAMSSKVVTDQVSANSRGSTRARVNLEVARNIEVPVPSISEQCRIANFLDAETARIDQLSTARVRQLSLISERYTAHVLDAIRGSLESSQRRKTGPPWLGEVPVDWPIVPVNYHFEVMLGKMLNPNSSRGDHLRHYLRNANVQWDRIDTADLQVMNFPPEERQRFQVQSGDLLVCEGGEPGRAAIWNGEIEEIYYQKALHRVRARGDNSPRWLYYCLRAATAQNVFAIEGNATTIAHLTGEQLRAQRFPFPAPDVQERLVKDLDLKAKHLEKLQRRVDQQLDLLAERRQALITAAVTGQFDVSSASGRGVTEGVGV